MARAGTGRPRRGPSPELAAVIDDFAARTGPGAFAVDRGEVADGLRRRLADPVTLDQGAATFSGPAAFVFCLVQDAPDVYVRFVIDLYEAGAASLGPLDFRPGETCRGACPKADQIAAVDWIALASLRIGAAGDLDFAAADDTATPITPPETVASWFAAAGYRHIRDETDPFFTKTVRQLENLRSLYMQDRRVCLFVSIDLLRGAGDKVRSVLPNQWVVLASPVWLADDSVTMTVYQWGSLRRAPEFGRLPPDRFCRQFYGYLAAMPPPRRPDEEQPSLPA